MTSPPQPPQLITAASRAALATYSRRFLLPTVGYPPPPPASLFRVRFLEACVFCAMHVELAPTAPFCRPAAFRRNPRRPRHCRDRLQPMPFFLRVGNFLPTSLPHFL